MQRLRGSSLTCAAAAATTTTTASATTTNNNNNHHHLKQDTYNYILETNHVYRVNSFATILWLQFMVHVALSPMFMYFYISTFDVLL